MKTVIKTPHAAVVVYNYRHRLGTEVVSDSEVNEVDEVIISSSSVTSIVTSKGKDNSIGNFQINLGPSRNWVSTLTSGSWLVILMSQSPITEADLKTTADPKKVKMLGRIDSVRTNVEVNQQSGAIKTSYTIHGTDWCSFLQNQIYLDAFLAAEDKNNIGASTTRLIINELIGKDGARTLHLCDDQLAGLLAITGVPLTKTFSEQAKAVNRVIEVKYSFSLPSKLLQFFGFVKQGQKSPDNTIANIIELFTGKLVSEDKYEATKESIGTINFVGLNGTYSIWQLLQDHCNSTLNELIADMRWTAAGPTLAIYSRIRPFAVTENLTNLASSYALVKKHKIPLEDIIGIEAGTNWRDKYNMVEIRFDANMLGIQEWENGINTVNQESDQNAFQREGLRAHIETSRHFPATSFNNGSTEIFSGIKEWVKLHKEWYFNTHRLINGTLTFAGQNDYIQIGDNLMIPIEVLGTSKKVNSKVKSGSKFLLLHIENIRNTFTVDEKGSRSFMTTVDFVRGLVCDANGKVDQSSFLDENVSKLDISDDTPKNVVTIRGK